jgi:DNA mismatch repair protein MutL
LSLADHFVILKSTPPCLYQQDFAKLMKALVDYLLCSEQVELADLLAWKQKMVPDRYFESTCFIADVAEIEKNPQCITRLVEKAVKIDTNVLMTQILEAQ